MAENFLNFCFELQSYHIILQKLAFFENICLFLLKSRQTLFFSHLKVLSNAQSRSKIKFETFFACFIAVYATKRAPRVRTKLSTVSIGSFSTRTYKKVKRKKAWGSEKTTFPYYSWELPLGIWKSYKCWINPLKG